MRILKIIIWFIVSSLTAFQVQGNGLDSVLEVRSVSITGNKVTNTSIILREVTFKEGDLLNEAQFSDALKLTRSNIINTNLFLEVDITPLIDSTYLSGMVDVLIRVKERWYLSILPHWTLADRSFNEWWYDRGRDLRRTTFGADVRHWNFTGNADQLSARVYFGFMPRYQLAYSRPYIDKKKRWGITAGAFFASQKNLAFRTWNDKIDFLRSDVTSLKRYGGTVDLRYRRNHNFFHTFHFGVTNSFVADTVVALNNEYFGSGSQNQLMFSLAYEYRIDYRDVRQYPLKGNFFIGSIGQYFSVGGKNQTNLLLRYNHYFPLSERLFLELGVRGKASFPREQSYFLVSGLGYGGNIARGYELYVVDGQYFMLSRNTLKLLAFHRKFNIDWIIKRKQFSTVPITIFPNLYLDYGFVRNFYPERSNSKLSNNHLVGGGAGLDVVTFYNVNFRAYYSVNKRRESGLFFSIGREF